jgi:hypothetical protein
LAIQNAGEYSRSEEPLIPIRRAETLDDLFATLDLSALPGFK